MKLVKLTLLPSEIAPNRNDPVWVNAFGVNAVQACKDGGTWVRMDDGYNYLVKESPRAVIGRLNKELES